MCGGSTECSNLNTSHPWALTLATRRIVTKRKQECISTPVPAVDFLAHEDDIVGSNQALNPLATLPTPVPTETPHSVVADTSDDDTTEAGCDGRTS